MKHTSAIKDISLSRDCKRLLTTAENTIYWQRPQGGSFVATQVLSSFIPQTANLAPTEAAIAIENTGEYSIYTITVNCSNVLHATTQVDSITCNCSDGFVWNGEICYRINCTGYSDTTDNASPVACNCIPNFYWNATLFGCIANCSAIANSNGIESDWSCFCNIDYVWFNGSCVLPLSCPIVAYSNGINVDPLTCECMPQYFWDSANISCNINCSEISHSNGTFNKSACFCIATFVWEEYRCIPNCSGIVNSKGNTSDPLVCDCNNYSNWNG